MAKTYPHGGQHFLPEKRSALLALGIPLTIIGIPMLILPGPGLLVPRAMRQRDRVFLSHMRQKDPVSLSHPFR